MDSEFHFPTVLVLAPHTDDGEFGCGGTIARLAEQGSRVVYVAFSAAEKSVSSEWPRDILRTEALSATAELGIATEDCLVLDFDVRTFPENRQRLLDRMIRLRNQFQPDAVLLPSTSDTHQDHHTVAQEGFRAFKRTTMLAYEVPWNNVEFRATCHVKLGDRHVDQKIAAISKYRSQSGRPYSRAEFIRALAVSRGIQANFEFAEAFEVVRWIMN